VLDRRALSAGRAAVQGGCIAGEPKYQSQNPKVPGSGMLFLVLCDGDSSGGVSLEGGDAMLVQVDTGPYEGYTNSCDPAALEPCTSLQGNITVTS